MENRWTSSTYPPETRGFSSRSLSYSLVPEDGAVWVVTSARTPKKTWEMIALPSKKKTGLKHWNINDINIIWMKFWKSNGHHFDTKDTSGRSQKLAVPKRGRGQLLLYRRFKVPPAAPGTFGRLHWWLLGCDRWSLLLGGRYRSKIWDITKTAAQMGFLTSTGNCQWKLEDHPHMENWDFDIFRWL